MARGPARFAGGFSVALAPLLTAVLTLLAQSVLAHELEVDSLSIRLESGSQEVAGQLLLDPEMTRGTDGASVPDSIEMEHERLLSFVKEHVVLRADEEALDLSLGVRELYSKGGAVPGDSVIYRAVLPRHWRELSVRIIDPLDRIAVTTTVDMAGKPTVLIIDDRPLVVHRTVDATSENSSEDVDVLSSSDRSILTQSMGQVWTGIVHIIPLGWDHILFVVALTLGSFGKWRRLVLELSAFTAAHTLTLALGALELVRVAPSIVEPLIALSISAVALEHLVALQRKSVRYALVCFFGLLHGLGFAGALLDLGLSKTSFLLFLVSFNIGVELGQLAVVGVTLVALWLAARWPDKRDLTTRALALVIAGCGLIVCAVRFLG